MYVQQLKIDIVPFKLITKVFVRVKQNTLCYTPFKIIKQFHYSKFYLLSITKISYIFFRLQDLSDV